MLWAVFARYYDQQKHLLQPGSGIPIPFVSNLAQRIVHGGFPSCHDERTDMSASLFAGEIVMGAAQVPSAAMC